MMIKANKKNERGAALVEFAIVATVFLTVMFGVLEFGRMFWTHNALRDAARRGVRLAAVRRNDAAGIQAVKNMVVFGNEAGTGQPIANGLSASNVAVEYVNYNGIQLSSRTTVSINNYQFQFSVPLLGGTMNMPAYRTSLPGESAGYIPCDTPTANPLSSCNIIPN
jgi:Flp pilus assembly protein TadG